MFKKTRRLLFTVTLSIAASAALYSAYAACLSGMGVTNVSATHTFWGLGDTAIVALLIPIVLGFLLNRYIKVKSPKRPWIYSILTLVSFLFLESLLFVVAVRASSTDSPSATFTCFKPVIYLYPTKQQTVRVELSYHGNLTTTYPAYDQTIKGWNVTAFPDGHLINTADHQNYSYLFWEGRDDDMKHDFSTGFVIAGKDTAAFLQKTLKQLGLTPKEYNEFIVYWLPKMENNPYNLIHFAGHEYTDTAPLEITPKPDSMLRVFMEYIPLSGKTDIAPQKITSFARKGFVVVEWGGTEVKDILLTN